MNLDEATIKRLRLRIETSEESIVDICRVFRTTERRLRKIFGKDWLEAQGARRRQANAGDIRKAKAPSTGEVGHGPFGKERFGR